MVVEVTKGFKIAQCSGAGGRHSVGPHNCTGRLSCMNGMNVAQCSRAIFFKLSARTTALDDGRARSYTACCCYLPLLHPFLLLLALLMLLLLLLPHFLDKAWCRLVHVCATSCE